MRARCTWPLWRSCSPNAGGTTRAPMTGPVNSKVDWGASSRISGRVRLYCVWQQLIREKSEAVSPRVGMNRYHATKGFPTRKGEPNERESQHDAV